MKALFARIPTALYNRFVRVVKANDLKIGAAVKQAVELWLKENNS